MKISGIPEAFKLQRFFSTFPGGPPGYGLLLLRVGLGCTLITYGISRALIEGRLLELDILLAIVSILSGFLVIIGFLTPAACIFVAVGGIGVVAPYLIDNSSASGFNEIIAIFAVIASTAILLIGPGAISVDARLFGRREITIPRK